MSINKEIIEQYIQFYNTFQIEEMVNLFSEDCAFENVSGAKVTYSSKGKQELLELSKKSAKYFKERKQEVTNWILSEDKAAVEINYTAVMAIDLPNGTKKGTTLKLRGASIYEFKEGKIKRLVDIS